jgi:hypothetical protein
MNPECEDMRVDCAAEFATIKAQLHEIKSNTAHIPKIALRQAAQDERIKENTKWRWTSIAAILAAIAAWIFK